MVAGHLCPKFVLERGACALHAPVVPADAAGLVMPELPGGGTTRPVAGVASISGPDHDPLRLEGVGYVRLAPSPAEDASGTAPGAVIEPRHRKHAKEKN